MACVILPSETARLVYGYLVKENLNEIAHTFLESSPYLTDCCQIVKSGYQFNTKLMNKDLQELLQEYSVIHNLVNNKVGLLQKTSLLYKRIKLRCESLPEILELILFWKYKLSKTDENSQSGNQEKNTSKETVNNTSESRNNITESDKNSKVEPTTQEVNECETNLNKNNNINNNNNANQILSNKNESSLPENFNSTAFESDVSMKEAEPEDSISQVHENVENHENNEAQELLAVETSKNLEKNECNKISINSIDISSCTNQNSNVNTKLLEEPPHSNSVNILTIDLNGSETHVVTDQIPSSNAQINEVNTYENHTKIVGVEEANQHQNHTLDLYAKPSVEASGSINFENTSVVFMDPVGEVGNVSIDQKRQLIFIPIDCQDDIQNRMEIMGSENHNLNQNPIRESGYQEKEEIIFEGVTATNSAIRKSCGLYDNQISTVDGNIITEKDFLNNKQFVFDLEKESRAVLQPQTQRQPPKPVEESNETVPIQAVSTPLIVVSTLPSNKPSRYRTILPKKEEVQPIFPVVVVQPFRETNSDSSKILAPKTRSSKVDNKEIEISKTEVSKSKLNKSESREEKEYKIGRRKTSLPQISKAREAEKKEGLKELESLGDVNKTKDILQESPKDLVNLVEAKEKVVETIEEKENVEKKEQKFENKKIETPVFVTKRNSKRLSLSTPRRRSHIRALEFETPPKTSEDRKKSKTSPKIKVDKVNVERKSVRNTLFKSPIPENSPVVSKDAKKTSPFADTKTDKSAEPLNDLSIPIATSSPNTKLKDAWESLTGVGSKSKQAEASQKDLPKKMWDADLRHFVSENTGVQEKKRVRKQSEKSQKNNRKATKKKDVSAKKPKTSPVSVPPSKISLTAKRNTYSINRNEEGSPIRSLLEDLKIVTPFKDIETIRPTEETPLTKLLRENINNIDIDLSMINTPSFPPTPSIIITPDLDDVSMVGANYYSPSKDKALKITDHLKVETEKINKKESKEMHEKVIGDLVSKAKEIIGIGKENQEENALMKRPSGKMLSMVKIQMLSQCDKKLCENIPINEENNFSNSFTNNSSLSLNEEGKQDIKEELEGKKKRTLEKIKENSTQSRARVNKRGKKRKRSCNTTKSDRSKSDISCDAVDLTKSCETDKNVNVEGRVFHSTPYTDKKLENSDKVESDNKINSKILEDIRQEFPPFENSTDKYPELTEKSRKKLHYVENFLKLNEITNFLNNFDKENPPKLFLKSSLRRFFQVFYKWLKHPHKREINASQETKVKLREYLLVFDKINKGLTQRNKRFKKDLQAQAGSSSSDLSRNNSGNKEVLSDDEEKEWKKREIEKRKDEESEDGVVLPLKKRKSTVQQVEIKSSVTSDKDDSKNTSADVTQTQNFLQDIDVDRFLSQIHGQENR